MVRSSVHSIRKCLQRISSGFNDNCYTIKFPDGYTMPTCGYTANMSKTIGMFPRFFSGLRHPYNTIILHLRKLTAQRPNIRRCPNPNLPPPLPRRQQRSYNRDPVPRRLHHQKQQHLLRHLSRAIKISRRIWHPWEEIKYRAHHRRCGRRARTADCDCSGCVGIYAEEEEANGEPGAVGAVAEDRCAAGSAGTGW